MTRVNPIAAGSMGVPPMGPTGVSPVTHKPRMPAAAGDHGRDARATPLLAAAIILVALVLIAPGVLPAADNKPAATAPAASTASMPSTPSTSPAVTPAAPKAKDKPDDAVPKALIDAARKNLVVVKIYFRKDTSETLDPADRDYRIAYLYDEYVDKKRPAEIPGLVLDGEGRVLIVDGGLEDRFIERIEVDAPGGPCVAREDKLLYDAPGTVLKVDAAAGKKLTPVRFAPVLDKGPETSMLQAAPYQVDDEWRVRFSSLQPTLPLNPATDKNVYFGHRAATQYDTGYGDRYGGLNHNLALLSDANGLPVGCALTSFIDLKQAECLWKGPDLLKAAGVDWAKLTADEDACRKQLLTAVHEVVMVLRQGAEEEEYRYRSSSGGGAAGREVSMYGVAISPTQIVVLQPLDSKMARQIEKMFVKYSPTERQEVEFVGAYKEIGAFVVKLTKGTFPATAKFAPADPPRMRPFWAAHLRKRSGQKYADLSINRLYGKARGYKGEYHWYAARPVPGGTFLVDFDGRIVGAYVHERTENEEETSLDAPRNYRGAHSVSQRVYTLSELRPLLSDPAAHLDPKVQVQPRTLAKRRAWLGVEFVPLAADLAEMLKVETPTKDGQLGFLINAVYPGSPAEKMEIKVGDILLRLQSPGMPYPIELYSRLVQEHEGYSGRFFPPEDEEGQEEEGGPAEPTWKHRQNFLTRALDAVGVGKTVKLSYWRPEGPGKGKTVTVDYKIELAPPDQDSAPKWRNRKLGLTVKDVTYEVRYALNLKPPAGVLVASVENGSPTLVARIFPNEVITRLDEKPLDSARQMRDLVAAAKAAGKDKVRLTILRLGKTRFADLSIAEYAPADDEGLDENGDENGDE